MTLEPDVAAGLETMMRERGITFKEAVNSTLRRGLGARRDEEPYKVPSRPMGIRPGFNVDKALQLAGELEDEEIARKLELNK